MDFFTVILKLCFSIIEDWKVFLFITTLFALYYYFIRTFDFFKKKGIPYMKPVILLGNLGPRFKAEKSYHQHELDIYNYFKGNLYGGVFEGRKPLIYIFDPDVLKAVTIRDFDYFTDRDSLNSNEPRFIKRFLINLKGSDWKAVRSTVTPAFSSARLRNMLPLIQQCSKQMVDFLRQYEGEEIEMKKTMGHFTLEVIGACAFGIECNALNSERSHFLQLTEQIDYLPKLKQWLLPSVIILIPEILPYTKMSFLNSESSEGLVRMLKAAKLERQTTNHKNRDFLQILIDFAKKEKTEINVSTNKLELDDDTIDGQCLFFLIAGYETSSSLLSFAIHVLATKPHIQEKLRNHIKEITEGKDITYELISELTYLDGFLLGSSVKLNVGDAIAISIYGIHMDSDIYPDPQLFRPERFIDEKKRERPSHLFLSFGVGPRSCIGMRFAMLSAKVAMIAFMKNFKFIACDQTVDPVPLDKRSIIIKTETGLWARVESL